VNARARTRMVYASEQAADGAARPSAEYRTPDSEAVVVALMGLKHSSVLRIQRNIRFERRDQRIDGPPRRRREAAHYA
jgi:hypothetical protein